MISLPSAHQTREFTHKNFSETTVPKELQKKKGITVSLEFFLFSVPRRRARHRKKKL